MLPILLAFAAGVLLAHVVRQLIVHHARDLAGRRAPADSRSAWLLPDDEDVIRRSRDVARRIAAADGAAVARGDGPHREAPRRERQTAAASPLRGFGVTFRVRL